MQFMNVRGNKSWINIVYISDPLVVVSMMLLIISSHAICDVVIIVAIETCDIITALAKITAET